MTDSTAAHTKRSRTEAMLTSTDAEPSASAAGHSDFNPGNPSNLDRLVLQMGSEALPLHPRPCSSLDEHISDLARVLKEHKNDSDASKDTSANVTRLLVGAALVFPHRVNAYATLMALVGVDPEEALRMAWEEAGQIGNGLGLVQFLRLAWEMTRVRLVEDGVETLVRDFCEKLFALHSDASLLSAYCRDAGIPGQEHHVAFEEHLAATTPHTVSVLMTELLSPASASLNPSIRFDSYDSFWMHLVLQVFSANAAMVARILLLAIPNLNQLSKLLLSALFLPASLVCRELVEVTLVHCCRVDPRGFPPAMARNLRAMASSSCLVSTRSEGDEDARMALARWFAFHLSNFEFRWNWEEWSRVADEEMRKKSPTEWSPLARFLHFLFDGLARLSYQSRLKAALPESLMPLIPTQLHEVERETFAFSEPGSIRLLDGKETNYEAIAGVIKGSASSSESINPQNISTSVLVQSMLFLGCKTCSHTMAVLDRHAHSLLQGRPPSDIFSAVLEYHFGRFGLPCELTLQRMLDLGILEAGFLRSAIADHLSRMNAPGLAVPVIPPLILSRRLSQ